MFNILSELKGIKNNPTTATPPDISPANICGSALNPLKSGPLSSSLCEELPELAV